MKKIGAGVSPRLILILLFAIIVPSGLLVLFGVKAVKNERYVLEHKIVEGFRESAHSLSLSVEAQLKNLDHAISLSGDLRGMGGGDHPAVQSVFLFGLKDRITYPARLPKRREIPLVFFNEYSRDFIKLYARETAGDKEVWRDYLDFSRRVRRQAGEEYFLSLSALARCGADQGNHGLGIAALRQITEDTVAPAQPLFVSRKLLGFLGRYALAQREGDAQQSVKTLNECHAYLCSDTAEVYEEEFYFYTRFAEQELMRLKALADPADFHVREAGRERLNREIAAIERHVQSGDLPDTGFAYADSGLYYVCRSAQGQKACLRINTAVIAGWVAAWMKNRGGLAVTVSFSDGREVFGAGRLDDPDEQVIAVTEALSRRLPFLNVTVGEKKQGEIYSLIRHQRFLYLLFLGVLVLAIAAGTGLVFLSVRREVEVARMRSNFISGVSHELRTPLTSIHMLSEMLKSGKVADERKKNEYYGLITRESERLTALINKILDFSRIDEGRIRYEMESHDIEAVIDDALIAMGALLDERDAAVIRLRSEIPVQVLCDRKMMTQVVVNLLDNAVKYSPEKPEIAVKTWRKEGRAFLSIRDHGIGIGEQEEERIFEEFYRASHERVKEVKGTGLGLAIVKKIVEEHRGAVTARAADGGGLEVVVELPAA